MNERENLLPNIYDLLAFGVLIAAIFYGFRRGIAKELFGVFKLFATFSLGGAFAFKVARLLTEGGFLRPDSLGLYFLWGFGIAAVLVYFGLEFLEKAVLQKYVYGKESVDKIFGSLILSIEAIFFLLVGTILLMQLTLSKEYAEGYLKKGIVYPKAKKTMLNALSYPNVKDISTGAIGSGKEAIINLFD